MLLKMEVNALLKSVWLWARYFCPLPWVLSEVRVKRLSASESAETPEPKPMV